MATLKDLTKNLKSFFTQGVQNINNVPLSQFSPMSMRGAIVPAAQTLGRAFNAPKLSQDVGYGLRGALSLTPFRGISYNANKPSLLGPLGGLKFNPTQQEQLTNPTTKRQRIAQDVGTGIYGSALTAGIGSGAPLANFALRPIQGGLIGGGFGVAKNAFQGKPLTENLGESVAGGVRNAPTLAFTGALLDKLAPSISQDVVSEGFKQLKVSSQLSAPLAERLPYLAAGVRALFVRSLAEVIPENTAFTLLDKMTDRDKRDFVTAFVQNLPGSIIGNLAYAGGASVLGGGFNLTSGERTQVSQAIKSALDSIQTKDIALGMQSSPLPSVHSREGLISRLVLGKVDTEENLKELPTAKLQQLYLDQISQKVSILPQQGSTEQIQESAGGWAPGSREKFDTALLRKNADQVKELLPTVPPEYQIRFQKEIQELTGELPPAVREGGFLGLPFGKKKKTINITGKEAELENFKIQNQDAYEQRLLQQGVRPEDLPSRQGELPKMPARTKEQVELDIRRKFFQGGYVGSDPKTDIDQALAQGKISFDEHQALLEDLSAKGGEAGLYDYKKIENTVKEVNKNLHQASKLPENMFYTVKVDNLELKPEIPISKIGDTDFLTKEVSKSYREVANTGKVNQRLIGKGDYQIVKEPNMDLLLRKAERSGVKDAFETIFPTSGKRSNVTQQPSPQRAKGVVADQIAKQADDPDFGLSAKPISKEQHLLNRKKIADTNLESPTAKQVKQLIDMGYSDKDLQSVNKLEAKNLIDNDTPPFMRKGYTSEDFSANEVSSKQTKAVLAEDQPEVFEAVARKWLGGKRVAITEGGEVAYKYKNLLKDIPENEKSFKEFMDHVEGVKSSNNPTIVKAATEWKQDTDVLYGQLQEQAKRVGIRNIGYIDDYATHQWDNPKSEVDAAFEKLTRSNPSFRGRSFESYEQGIKYGLTPKYKAPARVMGEYVKRLNITKNNLDLFEELKNNDLVVEGSIGRSTPGFEPINAPGFPRSSTSVKGKIIDSPYYAPSTIARNINNIFNEQNYIKFFDNSARAAQKFQNVSLSGGTPKAPVNAFFAAQLQKEMLSGRVRSPIKVFLTSISPEARTKYQIDNVDIIKEMQSQNALYATELTPNMVDTYAGMTKSGIAGEAWDRAMADPTFKGGMPMLQIEYYKDIKAKALKQGIGETEAQNVAAQAVKNFYGLIDPFKQAMTPQDSTNLKNTFLFAPYYREAMINFWTNNIRALKNPLALENQGNVRFIAGAAITYGLMNALNKMLNGHGMSENPENKQDKLLIPVGDTTIGIPFLSSIATVPRGLIREGKYLASGDIKKAGKDAFQTFTSMGIKPIGDLMMNQDYFGRPIYNELDDAAEKRKDQLAYLAEQAQTHPWIKSYTRWLKEGKQTDPMTVIEAISTAGELPFRFYDTNSILNSPFWEQYNTAKDLKERYDGLKYKEPAKAEAFYAKNQQLLDQLPAMNDALDLYFDEEEPNPAALIEFMGGDVPQFEQSADAPKSDLERLGLYTKSAVANPIQTIRAISNKEPIRKLRFGGSGLGGFFDSSTVTERKLGVSDLDQGDKTTQVDHKIPKWIGGSDQDSNYQLLTNEEHRAKTVFEANLRNQYEAGQLSRRETMSQIEQFNKQLNPMQIPEGKASEMLAEKETTYQEGLKEYSSGKGKTVAERADWAEEWLKNSSNREEFEGWYEDMLASGVITKSVLEALNERGLKLNRYTQAGKIKTLGGGIAGKKAKKVKFTKSKGVNISNLKTFKPPKTPNIKLKTPNIRTAKLYSSYEAPKIKAPKKAKIRLNTQNVLGFA